jgi:hypothetical protein
MKRFSLLFAGLSFLVSGCYTVVEVSRPAYYEPAPYQSSVYTEPDSLTGGETSPFDAYRAGYQDAQFDYVRFRDENRWLRWNQWQYWGPGFGPTPMFWSYNDFYWDPYFYWNAWSMPGWYWNTGIYGNNWAFGMGGGWNSWGWGNWAWNPPVVVIQPGNGVADNVVRGPRGSGRTLVVPVDPNSAAAAPALTPGAVNPATFGPTGGSSTGKGPAAEGGRPARGSGSSSTENAVRGTTEEKPSRGSSGVRGSGKGGGSSSGSSGSRSGSRGSSSGSGSNSGSSNSGGGRKPRGN